MLLRLLVVVAVATAALAPPTAANEVSGCSGFLSFPPSLKQAVKSGDLDVGRVKLSLRDADGVGLVTVPVAPTGYFFIPTGDVGSGSYVVTADAADGWVISPVAGARVAVSGDGVCNGGADVAFAFEGFAVGGAVGASAECGAAGSDGLALGGIKVSLVNAATGSRTASVNSRADGSFAFKAILPGSYHLVGAHPEMELAAPAGSDGAVTIGPDAAVLAAPSLVPTAYSLSGSVTSGGSALAGVNVLVFAAAGSAAARSACVPVTSPIADLSAEATAALAPADGLELVCTAMTSDKGEYRVRGLACGEYTLVPHHKTALAVFDLTPSSAVAAVGAAPTAVVAPFAVSGFTVSGRVVNAKGKGVSGATVSLDGEAKATTATDGFYVIGKVADGTYELSAAKDGTFFTSVPALAISARSPKLPDLAVTGYAVCGSVAVGDEFARASRTVSLATAAGDVVDSAKVSGAAPAFCFEATPGKYVVSVSVSNAEAAAGLVLNPRSVAVTVDAKPVADVDFAQSHIGVAGTITCLASPCPAKDLGVDLVSAASGAVVASGKVAATGAYTIDKVVPGKYTVAVRSGAASWCFADDEAELTVPNGAESPVAGPSFVQTGFALETEASHAFVLDVTHGASGEVSRGVAVPAGAGTLCLPMAGTYTLALAAGSCYDFAPVTYNTGAPVLVELGAKAFKVAGTIEVPRAAFGDAAVPAEVAVDTDGSVAGGASAVLDGAASDAHTAVYAYAFFVAAGGDVVVRPASDAVLFQPPARTVVVATAACPDAVDAFTGVAGVFMSGRTEPAMGGVNVVVSSPKSEAAAVTARDGTFTIGPLYADQDYTVAAAKPGFHFKVETGSDGSTVLRSVQLGSVEVDASGVEGVLLSLSGDAFRSNVATGADGTYTFDELLPGDYYLSALLKEYTFEPASASVTVVEGKVAKVVLAATRVAWSASGSVVALSGDAVAGVAVDALLPSGTVAESAVTAPTGTFRIRGLVPGTVYAIRVRDTDAGNALPASLELEAGTEDADGLSFVVVPEPSFAALSGRVAGTAPVAGMVVSVVGAKSGKTVATVVLDESRYFYVPGLARTAHVVSLATADGDVVVSADANLARPNSAHALVAHTDLVLPMDSAAEAVLAATEDDIASTPFFFLSAGIIAGAAFLYGARVRAFYDAVVFVPSADADRSYYTRKRSKRKK